MKIRAGAGLGGLRLLPRYGGVCAVLWAGGVGRYGRAARDAGQLWDANPLESRHRHRGMESGPGRGAWKAYSARPELLLLFVAIILTWGNLSRMAGFGVCSQNDLALASL